MSSVDSIQRFHEGSHDNSPDVWRLNTVNLFQDIIGAAYGLIDVEPVSILAKLVREPVTPGERALVQGVVLDWLVRKMPTMSANETLQLVSLIQEFRRLARSDISKVVSDLRRLLRLHGPAVAERIRDLIDNDCAKNPAHLVRQASCEFGLTPNKAKVEFQRRFGTDVVDCTMQRRVAEGIALIRAGMKIDSAAREVGFKKGKRHFYAAVRRVTGMTPGALRRNT